MIRKILLAGLAALAISGAAQAQDVTPSPGCQIGIPCKTGQVTSTSGGFIAPNNGVFQWNSFTILTSPFAGGMTLSNGGSNSFTLAADAANTLALRNGVNAQSVNVYNTYTDASNYERAVFDWTTNANGLTIGTTQAGTGAARSVFFNRAGSAKIVLASTGIQFGDNLLAATDATYNIGAVSANRPNNIFAASNVVSLYAKNTPNTVAALASCTGIAGTKAFVSDSTVAGSGNFGAAVAGGGSNPVPVYCDGTTWRIG